MMDNSLMNTALPVLWEKSYLCPCRNRATQQPNMTCPLCKGRGIAYLPPTLIYMTIQSQDKGISNADLGLIESGTALGTPADRNVQVAFRDRITLKDVKIPQSFLFDVSDNRIKNGFYMVYDVNQITYAVTMDGELTEGVDYTFDRENNIFYPNEKLKGKNVSLNLLTTLRYMVADLLKEHRYGKDEQGRIHRLPQKLLLKREDIFIAREAFEIGSNDNTVGQMIDTKRQPTIDGLNGFFRMNNNG